MLTSPIDPSYAPQKIDLSVLQKDSDAAWSKSLPGEKSLEHGYTMAYDPEGKLHALNAGSGTATGFTPDFSLPGGYKLLGVFHTHPYSKAEGGYTGVSFSSGDLVNLINDPKRIASVVQSGAQQFLMLRTNATISPADKVLISNLYDRTITSSMKNGSSWSDATRAAAIAVARISGLSYYEGGNGVFNRKVP